MASARETVSALSPSIALSSAATEEETRQATPAGEAAGAAGTGIERIGKRAKRADTIPSTSKDAAAHAVRKARITIAIALVLLVAFSLCALSIGRYSIPLNEVFAALFGTVQTAQANTVVNDVRLPRILGAVIVGGALSIAGASYQGLFRNPLVSPDLLGVSSGACVGAAIAILLGLSSAMTGFFAMGFGIAAVCLTVLIPKLFRNGSNLMLILSGVLISGFMNSILGFIKYIADPDEELADIVYWTMGSLASVRWESITSLAPLIIVPAIIIVLLGWRINLLTLGEKEARSLGTNTKAMKALIIVCSTLLTSTATCITGTIGWIGLIIPHFVRLLIGEDNRFLMPLSIIAGAMFLLAIDTLARTLTASEIPLSIFTGILAVPLFTVLLIVKKPRVS